MSTSIIPGAKPWLPGTGRQRLFVLWLLVLGYLLLQCIYPVGPWYHHFQYALGLVRSWAIALVTLWIGVLVAVGRPGTVPMRLAVLGAFLLLSVGVRWTLDEDRRLRAALQRADHLVIHTAFIGENIDRVLTVIHDDEAIQRVAETLQFDQDPPWRMIFHFTCRGEFTVDAVGRDGEIITDFIVIGRGEAIRWRPVMSTDGRTPEEFQEALVDAVLHSIPEDAEIALSGRDPGLVFLLLAWCKTPEAVGRLAAMIPHVNSHERVVIARFLSNQPDEAIVPLMGLAQDPVAEVRLQAISSLGWWHSDVNEVRDFLFGYDIDAEPDPEVSEEILGIRSRFEHGEELN